MRLGDRRTRTLFVALVVGAFVAVILDQLLQPRGLQLMQMTVEAILRQQCPVTALLHDLALVHHQNPVGLDDSGQAMGDYHQGDTTFQRQQ